MRKALYILSLLTDADINWLVGVGQRETLSPREVLIQGGEPISALYIIIRGEFVVTLRSGHELARLGAGEVLGEISFLDPRPPLATVAASSDGMVLAIPRATLIAKLGKDDGFAARFYRAVGCFLASRLRGLEGSMSDGDADTVDELPEDLMENVSLGGARFAWILKQLAAS